MKLVDFVQEVLAQNRVRIIGVCFGHQVLGRALGVKVDKSLQGWETSVTPMTLTETGKQLFGVEKMVSIFLLTSRETLSLISDSLSTKCTAASSSTIQMRSSN